jgi:hypothetical protein
LWLRTSRRGSAPNGTEGKNSPAVASVQKCSLRR